MTQKPQNRTKFSLFSVEIGGTVQKSENFFTFFRFFVFDNIFNYKNSPNSMMQFTHKSYQPAESRKDFGRFVASIDNWARVLGTSWRVEEMKDIDE